MVYEPTALRNTVGENLIRSPIVPSLNVALFGVWAEASGDRNETPAARTSRKRKARVRNRETPARVAESKRGGGIVTGGPRLVACSRAHVFAPRVQFRFLESRRRIFRRGLRYDFHTNPPAG